MRIGLRTLVCSATALMLTAAVFAAAGDELKLKKDAVDQHMLMEWHNRAFGQAKLAIARKEKDPAALHAWLLAQMADQNTRQTEDAQYAAWAAEVRQHATDMFAAAGAEDWERARNAAKSTDDSCKKCHDVHAKEAD